MNKNDPDVVLLNCLHKWTQPAKFLFCERCGLNIDPARAAYICSPERAQPILERYIVVLRGSREIYRLIAHESPPESHSKKLKELYQQESSLWPLVKLITVSGIE